MSHFPASSGTAGLSSSSHLQLNRVRVREREGSGRVDRKENGLLNLTSITATRRKRKKGEDCLLLLFQQLTIKY